MNFLRKVIRSAGSAFNDVTLGASLWHIWIFHWIHTFTMLASFHSRRKQRHKMQQCPRQTVVTAWMTSSRRDDAPRSKKVQQVKFLWVQKYFFRPSSVALALTKATLNVKRGIWLKIASYQDGHGLQRTKFDWSELSSILNNALIIFPSILRTWNDAW